MPKRQSLPSEDILWSIIDRLPVGIYIKDVDCRFTYVNVQGTKNLHIDHQDEAMGKTDADFFDTNQAKDWIVQEKRIMALQEEMIDQKELELWPDGKRTWVLTSKLPVVGPDGTVRGLFGMTKDITEWERINLAVAGAREGLWYRAVNSDDVWYSPHWKRILGYADKELPNLRAEFRKRVLPQDWPLVEKACNEHFDGTVPYYECCFRMRNKDGRERWIRSRGMVTRDDSSGKPQVFAGSHVDITDSLDLERFYLTVLDTIPNLIFVKGRDLRFVFVNEAVAEIFNKHKDEIVGKTDAELNPDKEQVERFVEADRYVISKEKPIDIPEEELTDARGNKRTLTTRKMPLIYPGKKDTHVLGVATDITELKTIREDLKKILNVLTDAVKEIEESETEDVACQSVLLQLARLGYPSVMLSFLREINSIRTIVADSRYATANFASVASLTHQPFDVPEEKRELLATVLAEKKSRFIPDSASDAQCDTKLFKECGIVSQYIVPIATESLLIGIIQIDLGSQNKKPETACSMFDALGKHLSLAISRFRALERLDEANNVLMGYSKFAIANEVAASMIHQLYHEVDHFEEKLRNELKKQENKQDSVAFKVLRKLQEEVGSWRKKLAKPLEFMRVEDGKKVVSLNSVVQDTLEYWYEHIHAKKCNLRFIQDDDDILVEIFPTYMREALSCLIVNALQAHARTISVSIEKSLEYCGADDREDCAVLRVADNGDGVPSSYAKKIFEQSFTTKSKRGTGMGLFITKRLAEAMSGDIVMESGGKSAGVQNTVFKITIPAE